MTFKVEAGYETDLITTAGVDNTNALFKNTMTSAESEEDKIERMQKESSDMYSQKNWQLLRGRKAYEGQRVPATYKCNRCNQGGHFIYDCPQGNKNTLPNDIKRTTGIPRSFLKPATAETPGAKINLQG